MCVCPGVQTSSSKKQIIIMRLLRSRTLPAKGIFSPPFPFPTANWIDMKRKRAPPRDFDLFWHSCVWKPRAIPPLGESRRNSGREQGVNVTLSFRCFGLRLRRAELVQFSKAFHEKTGWNRMSGSKDGHPVWVSCHAELSSITVRTWTHETTLIVKVS